MSQLACTKRSRLLKFLTVIALVVDMGIVSEAAAILIPISSSEERFDLSPSRYFDYDTLAYEKRFDPYGYGVAISKRGSSEENDGMRSGGFHAGFAKRADRFAAEGFHVGFGKRADPSGPEGFHLGFGKRHSPDGVHIRPFDGNV